MQMRHQLTWNKRYVDTLNVILNFLGETRHPVLWVELYFNNDYASAIDGGEYGHLTST